MYDSFNHLNIHYLTVTSVPWHSAHSLYVVKLCQALGQYCSNVTLHCGRKNTSIKGPGCLIQYGIDKPLFRINQFVAPFNISFMNMKEWEVRFYYLNVNYFFLILNKSIFYKKKSIFICHHPITAVICALFRASYVYDFHADQFQNKTAKWLIKQHPPFICFCQSESLETIIKKRMNFLKICIIRNAYEKELLEIPGLETHNDFPVRIGYIGSLGEDRGIPQLLNSFNHLCKKGIDVELIIGGGNIAEVAKLRNLVINTEYEKRIVIKGFIDRQELIKTYAYCDILIAYYQSSLPAIKYMSPMKLFEYMATGRCIVASRVQTIEEFVDDKVHAYLVDPDKYSEFEKALCNLCLSRDTRIEYGKNAKRNKALITWEQKAYKILFTISQESEIN